MASSSMRNKGSYASNAANSGPKAKTPRRPSSYVTLLSNAEKKTSSKSIKDRVNNENEERVSTSIDPATINNDILEANSTTKSSRTNMKSQKGGSQPDISKLLLNIKLLKESLRSATVMGGPQFDEELGNYICGFEANNCDDILESTWLVKRAISELHVMNNRRAQGNKEGGSASVSAEFSLAGQLTEARTALKHEKELRINAENKFNQLEHNWADEKLRITQEAKDTLDDAVNLARKEGELATERLAERLKKADRKGVALEDKVRVAEMKLADAMKETKSASMPDSYNTDPLNNGNKDKRLLHLEKQVSTMRRKESDLTSINISLEAKVDRLTRELRAQRPAPNSRGKVAELGSRVDELDSLLTSSKAELDESRALQHELSTEVASLSVSRAERDSVILELRHSLEVANGVTEQLQNELIDIKTKLAECEQTRDSLFQAKQSLEQQLKVSELNHKSELDEVVKSSEMELFEATNHIEVVMEKAIDKVKEEKEDAKREYEKAMKELEVLIETKTHEIEFLKETSEQKLRQIEEDNLKQLEKARAHCELLTAEELVSREDKGRMQARISELTGRLKESQNARLDLQVRVHETSVKSEALTEELAILQREVHVERQGRASASEEVVDLRDQVTVLRQLESQVQSLLEAKKIDGEALKSAEEELVKLSHLSESMKSKDQKLLLLEKQCKELQLNMPSQNLVQNEIIQSEALALAAEERAVAAASALSSARAAASSQRHTFEKRISSLEELLRNSERKEAEMSKQLATARRNLARRSSRTFEQVLPSSDTSNPPNQDNETLTSKSEVVDEDIQPKRNSDLQKVSPGGTRKESNQSHHDDDDDNRQPLMRFGMSGPHEDSERSSKPGGGSLPRSGTTWLEQRRPKPKFFDDTNVNPSTPPKKRSHIETGEDDVTSSSSPSISAPLRKAPPPPPPRDKSEIHARDEDAEKEESLSMDELRQALELQQKQIERLEQSQQQSQVNTTAQETVTPKTSPSKEPHSPPRVSPPPSGIHTPRRMSKTPDTPVYLQHSIGEAVTDSSKSPLSHVGNVSTACTAVWSGVGVHCVRRRCTVQQVWSVEFDRARTTRNTATQFSSGLGRCGFRASPSDSSTAFREMQDEARRRRKEEELQIIKAEKTQTGYSRCVSNGVMLEGTVGCEDFVDAAARWLCHVLSDIELAALGLGTYEDPNGSSSGSGSSSRVDILNDLNEECTFAPKLNKSTSSKSKPSSFTRRNSIDGPSTGLERSPTKSSVSFSGSGSLANRKRAPRAASPHSSRGSTGGRGGGGGGGKSKYDGKPASSSSKASNNFDLSEALGNIIGQEKLKEQLLAFEKGIELQARRKELGIDCDGAWPPHMMFCGNPGTGKTTIARLVGLVLKKLGVLKRGHLVEVQRSDLVAGAIGQTALKTRDKINEARGGVLFVDEAYTLAPGGGAESKDFGREAINEIMSVMNDGDPVVIFAGYKKEMETFVQANAGLFRRIDVRYDFENYSTLELALILRREVSSAGFMLDKDVTDQVVSELFEKFTAPTLRNMMGGGLSRQLFRKARGKLDAELSLDATPEAMCTLSDTHLLAGLADITPCPPDTETT